LNTGILGIRTVEGMDWWLNFTEMGNISEQGHQYRGDGFWLIVCFSLQPNAKKTNQFVIFCCEIVLGKVSKIKIISGNLP